MTLRTLLWALLLALPHPGQDKKASVPDATAQKEAEKVVREVFKEDYAKKTPADRQALARKLQMQGIETKDNPSFAFVLLREARDMAVQVGDSATAMEAVTELARRFEINSM